ncbi:MAG: O-antigen polymerase [Bryobacteraceae bacterium]
MFYLFILIEAAAIATYAAVRLRCVRDLFADPTWPLLFGFAMNFCIRPLLLALDGERFAAYSSYHGDWSFSEHDILLVSAAAATFLLSFLAARWLAHHAGLRRIPIPTIRVRPSERLFLLVASALVILAPLGFTGYLADTEWSGGARDLLTGQARFHILGRHMGLGQNMLGMIAGGVGCAMLCTAWSWFGCGPGRVKRMAIAAVLLCGSVYWMFGERSGIVTVLYFLGTSYIAAPRDPDSPRKRFRPRTQLLVIAICLCAFLIAGPLGSVLKGSNRNLPDVVALAISPWDGYELTLFAVAGNTATQRMNGLSYVEDVVYTYLPRVFFSDKPVRYGIYSVQDEVIPALKQMPGSFPVGFVAEAYVNFGWAGFVLVPLLLGALCEFGSRAMRARDGFWTVQIMLLYPNIASFRSLGSLLAQSVFDLLLCGLVWGGIRMFCYPASTVESCAPPGATTPFPSYVVDHNL